jgi:rhamnose utilization protein RhaD (predicted bifunctional aldolase and dehydrogenase)
MAGNHRKRINALLRLSHELGREERQMAILGEGNTSARVDAETFLIKASGAKLATMRTGDVVECKTSVLLSLLNRTKLSDGEIEKALLSSRVNPKSKKPSVEALFHASCLTLEGVNYIGHAHPIAVNQVLCSPRAREFAERRIFPDEIVCCGATSVFVPYTDPGFQLARAIRVRTTAFVKKYNQPPRIILMENHGIVALGRTPEAVLAAMLMAEKAAAIWIGASALGGPKVLSRRQVERIAGRLDERYRQRVLKL